MENRRASAGLVSPFSVVLFLHHHRNAFIVACFILCLNYNLLIISCVQNERKPNKEEWYYTFWLILIKGKSLGYFCNQCSNFLYKRSRKTLSCIANWPDCFSIPSILRTKTTISVIGPRGYVWERNDPGTHCWSRVGEGSLENWISMSQQCRCKNDRRFEEDRLLVRALRGERCEGEGWEVRGVRAPRGGGGGGGSVPGRTRAAHVPARPLNSRVIVLCRSALCGIRKAREACRPRNSANDRSHWHKSLIKFHRFPKLIEKWRDAVVPPLRIVLVK